MAKTAHSEREITQEVALGTAAGVNPAAVGWSRRPLHACDLEGPRGRRKRWHHWCVTSSREVIAITLADLDYVGLATLGVLDRETGKATRALRLRPLGLGLALPSTAARGSVEFARRGTRIAFHDDGARVLLSAEAPGLAVSARVERPEGHESLGVAVTWPGSSGRHFAYSSKQLALPVQGSVTVRGVTRPLERALATLDWGRGVWPHRSSWNWASATGEVEGRTVAINLGARWTDGGGATENALLVDGKLTKLSGEVRFEWDTRAPKSPWRLHGPGVELVVTPRFVEDLRLPGVGRLCLVTGDFNGTAGGLQLRGFFGGSEELVVRW